MATSELNNNVPVERESLAAFKAKLQSLMVFLPKVRAAKQFYLFDASAFDVHLVEALNREYNQALWGEHRTHTFEGIHADESDIIKRLRPQDKVLEVGCGFGRLTQKMAEFAGRVVGIDYVQPIIDAAKKSVNDPKVSFLQGDAVNLEFNDNDFDVVMYMENGLGGLCSAAGRMKAIDELIRVCRPGGRIILCCRQLMYSSCDQLIITRANPNIMGVYHAFDRDEVNGYLRDKINAGMITPPDYTEGGPRDAGGSVFYVEFHKIQPGST